MKKKSQKQRERQKLLNERYRLGLILGGSKKEKYGPEFSSDKETISWIEKHLTFEIDYQINGRNEVSLNLPERLDFSANFDRTAIFIQAIRRLCQLSKKRYLNPSGVRLRTVNFDSIKSLSTSAGLVLAAEISRWNDSMFVKLTPQYHGWDRDIQVQLTELGFFELFKLPRPAEIVLGTSKIRTIKYLKSSSGDATKAVLLKEAIETIIGDTLDKSQFLFQGLSEAITNVCEHAYPYRNGRKNWYVTGGFDIRTNELKIAFYDQGIGIPRSLPASGFRENLRAYLAQTGVVGNDSALVKAAVELGRTRTGKEYKGKGLQDLHEFIRQREQGYLSILSLKGLYKFEKANGEPAIKSEQLLFPILGTLIIWSVILK